MAVSEYEVENLFIERLGTIGYQFIQLRDYAEVKKNFKDQLQKFNKAAIIESKGNSELSDSEFDRLLTQIENKTVFDSAKILRDKQLLELDNGKTVYIEFLSKDTERNIYQVTHQVTMNKEHQGDVVYKNRYDVTVHFPKLTSVAFVNNKHALFCFIGFHDRLVSIVAKRTCEFLNGCNKHFFSAVFQAFNELGG